MSGKHNRSDYLILGALGVCSALFILAMIGRGLLREELPAGPPARTTLSTNVQGTMACYMLFKRLGWQVRRSERPFFVESLGRSDVLFFLDPIVPMQAGEPEELKRWVRGGGVLVCTEGPARTLRYLTDDVTDESCRVYHAAVGSEDSQTAIPPARADLPLARDLKAVHLCSSETLEVREGEGKDELGPAEPLLSDTKGLRVLTCRVGSGRVILLADSSFLATGWIGRADNAIAAANLAAYSLSKARGNRLAFDEYHYGYGSRQSGWTTLAGALFRTSAGWAVLSVTAAGLLFLIYKGRRFGTRRAPPPSRRRSKLEYVYSVGATYRAARANRLSLRLIYHWLKANCAGMVGLPESADYRQVAARLARRADDDPERYEKVFAECEEVLTGQVSGGGAARDGGSRWEFPAAGRRLSKRRFSALLHALGRIESEISNGHPTGK